MIPCVSGSTVIKRRSGAKSLKCNNTTLLSISRNCSPTVSGSTATPLILCARNPPNAIKSGGGLHGGGCFFRILFFCRNTYFNNSFGSLVGRRGLILSILCTIKFLHHKVGGWKNHNSGCGSYHPFSINVFHVKIHSLAFFSERWRCDPRRDWDSEHGEILTTFESCHDNDD